ncbi:uncharacterized protein V1510DRAFT_427000 [Dipodascopsis tothii]|uniref:uncharacterized protein n=1 Tax=Dipodascopsis tothii TaxID=44089 RepID=UPI0034CD5062
MRPAARTGRPQLLWLGGVVSHAVASATRKKRLPNDVVGQLEDKARLNPLSHDTWMALGAEYVNRGKVEGARDCFERALKVFPTSKDLWLRYIDLEQSHDEFANTEALFARCLKQTIDLDLWIAYLNYVRRRNNLVTGGTEARNVILQAFDMVVGKVGLDRASGALWDDYLDFVKADTTGMGTTWAQQQKMDLLRKIYQRAVTVPMDRLEAIWQEYNAFENSLNKTTARKFLADRSAAYMTARTSFRESQQLLQGLQRNAKPSLPRWRSNSTQKQYDLWRKWIDWEKSDPLVLLDEGNRAGLVERVLYTYKQALQGPMRFFPQLWFDAAEYCAANAGVPGADEQQQTEFLRQGLEANKCSLLLGFRLAEVYELTRQKDEARKVFESVAAAIKAEIKRTEELSESHKQRLLAERSAETGDDGGRANGRGRASDADETMKDKDSNDESGGEDNENDDDDDDNDPFAALIDSRGGGHAEPADAGVKLSRSSKRRRRRSRKVSKSDVRLKKLETDTQELLEELAKDLTISNMVFMKAMKRMDGIKAARTVFGEARQLSYTTYHIFVASALMEYHHNKGPDIASKVFEIGLKRFADRAEYVLQYLNFLILINDDVNARALFERMVSKLSKDAARPLFDRFYAYESAFGELAAVAKLEKRIAELYPDVKPMDRFMSRYASVGGAMATGPPGVTATAAVPVGAASARRAALNNPAVVFRERDVGPLAGQGTKRGLDELEDAPDGARKRRQRDRVDFIDPESDESDDDGSLGTIGGARGSGSIGSLSTAPQMGNLVKLISALPTPASYKAATINVDGLMALLEQTPIPNNPPRTPDWSKFMGRK